MRSEMVTAMVMLAMVVALWMVEHASSQAPTEAPDDKFNEQPCWRGKEPGLCLHDVYCDKNFTMLLGGNILQYEIRTSGDRLNSCESKTLRCCTFPPGETDESLGFTTKAPSPTNSPSNDRKCSRVFDTCTWCAALYREAGDVSRGQRTESGLYCGGSLVSSRVVLTSATCVRTPQEEIVYVRLPNGDYPDQKYKVVDKIMHPSYASGNHTNDFGLMVLDEDVKWDGDFVGEACMEYQTPRGECLVVGFSASEEIVMSPVSVRDGPCRKKRGGGFGEEMACGERTGQCHADQGTPVLCPVTIDGQGGMSIVGVVRMHCIRNKVLLGKVQQNEDWLTRELKKLGVEPALYNP